ncbi:MAG TPA: CocE/NonD family hydrolase [Myxococcota bacterium]|nr:CocE/NonD family hydrolase [Myxococcota bacterium]
MTTRDGTKLSYFLTLPGPPENGPYPTVVSYSGYSPSRPGRVLSSEIEPFCEIYPILCNAPDDPSNMIAALIGFATIGVNMRGTGCSDGGYDYFEEVQLLDGYDVIEIVGRQPWVKNNKVGMVGISFPGISQLFVASQRPPHLGAIAPQSVIADSATSCLLPGGIYNDGFAQTWHDMVLYAALPYHHGWVRDVIDAGDELCDRHQKMHLQQRDAIAEGLKYPYYTDEVAMPMDPSAWVDKIQVPVFMTGQWHDEQTGPHFAALMDKFTGSPSAHFTVTNGFHNDSASPQSLIEWMKFLYLFVSKEKVSIPDDVRGLGPMFMEQVFGAQIQFPKSDIEDNADTYEEALAMWNARPPVKVIFETGAAPKTPAAAPAGTFDVRFDEWPLPGTEVARWYLGPNATLNRQAPDAMGGFSSFAHDAAAGHKVILSSGDVYRNPPNWNWGQPAFGTSVEFLTEPLDQDTVMGGHGSADLWIRTDATDADLEVTVTEVRADGKESYVQAGWLRASHRALRADATELRPVKSHRFDDVSLLTPGEWTPIRLEIMPFTHIFRAGSRIRVIIDTPGDSMTRWKFRLVEFETPPTIDIGHDADHPSSIALPLVPGVQIPTTQPACTSLRGQPCRDYQAITPPIQ